MLVPLYGFLAGDVVGVVVLVHDHQLVADIAACLQEAALPRVARAARVAVLWRGTRLDPGARIADTGIEALDRIDVIPEAP